jgi:hypothetical protein
MQFLKVTREVQIVQKDQNCGSTEIICPGPDPQIHASD